MERKSSPELIDGESSAGFWCKYCEKSLSSPGALKTHERIHAESQNSQGDESLREQPYKCQYCDKAFRSNQQLKLHIRVHTGEKPYKCNYCGKLFRSKQQLVAHERVHTGVKPHKCSYCEKAFASHGNKIVHERIHTGRKPYSCKYCHKAFNQSSSYKAHERMHETRSIFDCNYCQKRFSQVVSWTTHEDVCDKKALGRKVVDKKTRVSSKIKTEPELPETGGNQVGAIFSNHFLMGEELYRAQELNNSPLPVKEKIEPREPFEAVDKEFLQNYAVQYRHC